MHAYTELIPPSAVTHTIALPFLGARETNLVVVKTALLQIFRVRHAHVDGIGNGRGERLWLVGEYPLAGTVTGVAAVRTLDSKSGGQALILALRDAKLSLVEWDPENHRIRTISIHYYEGDNLVHEPFAPALSDCDSILTVDPESRCAAFKFGSRQLAILPFRQTGDDMIIDELEDDLPLLKRTQSGLDNPNSAKADQQIATPYKASFVLPLTALDPTLKHPIHLAFLHEYREPTFGILSAPIAPTVSLAVARKDILTYSAFSLDLEQRASTNLVSVINLPSDLWKVVPMPLPVGGALLLGTNELIHVDQSGKTVAVAVNEFAATASDFSMADQSALRLKLEGCEMLPLDAASGDLVIVLQDGGLAVLHFRLQGRSVSGMTIEKVSTERGGHTLGVMPSSAASLPNQIAFIGSEDGDSSLISWTKSSSSGGLSRKRSHLQMLDEESVPEDEDVDDDLDDDDLYAAAPSSTSTKRKTSASASEASAYSFVRLDSLPSLGPINAFSFGRIPTESSDATSDRRLQMLAGIGRGRKSRLALMSRDLVPKVKRRDDQRFGGVKNLWSLHASVVQGEDSGAARDHNMIFTYDGSRTRVYEIKTAEIDQKTEYVERTGTEFEHDGETLLVESVANGNRIVHCRRNEIRSYDAADLALSQIIPMLDDDTDAELSIVHVSVVGPWILAIRDDGSLQVLQADKAGDVEPLDTPEQVSARNKRWRSGCVYTGSLHPGQSGPILIMLDEQCELHIFSLPSFDRSHHLPSLPFLSTVLSPFEQERRRGGQRESITEVLVADIGEGSVSSTYLFIRAGEDGRDILIYEPFVLTTPAHSANGTTDPWQALRFRKICSELEPVDLIDEDSSIERGARTESLRPIVVGKYAAVRLTRPSSISLLIKERTDPPRILGIRSGRKNAIAVVPLHRPGMSSGFGILRATAPLGSVDNTANGDSNDDGEVDEEVNATLEECQLPDGVHCGTGWFTQRIELQPQHEPFDCQGQNSEIRHIAYHEHNGKGYWIVASCANIDFEIPAKEDEEAISLHPQVSQYTLHLLSATTFRQVHSQVLPYLEIITDLKTMTLETSEQSHDLGERIVVSAGLQRGEDSTARGVLYVFHILDVVPDPELPESGVQLHMFSREETKGIVTAIEGFPGGLIGTAQGQKLMVRGLKEDGSCLPVAFLDAQAYTISLRALANSGLWLAADAAKGLWLGGFTQEPYRLTTIGKSRSRMEVLAAELLPFDGGLYVLVVDADLDLQILQYDPENPKSLSGTRLLHKATFHLGHMVNRMYALPSTRSPAEAIVLTNGHANGGTGDPTPQPHSQLFQVLTTSMTGAIGLITPLNETTYRRVTSIQTHLTNVLEHAAGLNPRAFHFAGDEASGGRGVVDGSIVKRIWELGSARRGEVLARAGSDAWVLRDDLAGIDGTGGLGYL